MLSRLKDALGAQAPKTIDDIHPRAAAFDRELKSLKSQLAPSEFSWYPYSSMGVFEVLKKLLGPEHRELLRLAGDSPILDAGCGDGDLSFFFESLGHEVYAVDCPATNHNGMQGVAALKQARGSQVRIFPVDLDTQFRLPGKHFGLCLFLGILYHLKNPYYVLENLAQSVDYCLLSTRIAALSPDGRTIRDMPAAYLLGEGEANNDWTNYWIFSEAGLRRILQRTGWEVLDFMTTGRQEDSDPVRDDRDERAYCLIRSSRANPEGALELLEGWHELEQGTWRWTARRFLLRYRPSKPFTNPVLRFDFSLPVDGALELQAVANGRELPTYSYFAAGPQVYEADLPHGDEWDLEFRVKTETQAPGDSRELGVIVSFDRAPVRIIENTR